MNKKKILSIIFIISIIVVVLILVILMNNRPKDNNNDNNENETNMAYQEAYDLAVQLYVTEDTDISFKDTNDNYYTFDIINRKTGKIISTLKMDKITKSISEEAIIVTEYGGG